MGQICIAKTHRKKGIFRALYKEMIERMSNDFDFIVTEVAHRNSRSLNAHYAIGFKNVKEYSSESGEHWVILLLELNKKE